MKKRSSIQAKFFVVFLILVCIGAVGVFSGQLIHKKEPKVKTAEEIAAEAAASHQRTFEYLKNRYGFLENEDAIQMDSPIKYDSTFEVKDFTVSYPKTRKVYGEDNFSLCPVSHCQDSEMIISSEDKALLTWLEEKLSLRIRNPERFQITVFSNFKVGERKGYAVQSLFKEDASPSGKVFFALPAGKKIITGLVDIKDPVHTAILSSLTVK